MNLCTLRDASSNRWGAVTLALSPSKSYFVILLWEAGQGIPTLGSPGARGRSAPTPKLRPQPTRPIPTLRVRPSFFLSHSPSSGRMLSSPSRSLLNAVSRSAIVTPSPRRYLLASSLAPLPPSRRAMSDVHAVASEVCLVILRASRCKADTRSPSRRSTTSGLPNRPVLPPC